MSVNSDSTDLLDRGVGVLYVGLHLWCFVPPLVVTLFFLAPCLFPDLLPVAAGSGERFGFALFSCLGGVVTLYRGRQLRRAWRETARELRNPA
jgi:hypothetical protein